MGAPSSKTYYFVFANMDVTKVTPGQGASAVVYDNEEAAIAYANSSTSKSGGYKSTLAVATKLVSPKPVEMITQDIASC